MSSLHPYLPTNKGVRHVTRVSKEAGFLCEREGGRGESVMMDMKEGYQIVQKTRTCTDCEELRCEVREGVLL